MTKENFNESKEIVSSTETKAFNPQVLDLLSISTSTTINYCHCGSVKKTSKAK